MSLRSLLVDTKDKTRSGFVWNTASSGLFALQSLVMLIVTQHVLGSDVAGILVLAQAISFLLGCVGTFGVARFQASDVTRRFSLAEYAAARVVTVVAMWAAAVIVLLWRAGHYGTQEVVVIVLMTLLKTVDVTDDVVANFFTQHGRIYIGARLTAIRYIVLLLVFSIGVIQTRNLTTALCITLVASVAVFAGLASLVLPQFVTSDERRIRLRQAFTLIGACVPMFISWFLTAYINNAPKYAIDAVSDNTSQAIFGFLATPTFVVSLVAQFMFNPLVYRYSVAWSEARVHDLWRSVARMVLSIIGIGIAVCGVGFAVGLPVLSWLYGVDLYSYRAIFMILLVAGTSTALVMFLYTILTIMRRQTQMAIGFGVVSLAALLGGAEMVRAWGILGAALLYLSAATLLVVYFAVVAAWSMARRRDLPSVSPSGFEPPLQP